MANDIQTKFGLDQINCPTPLWAKIVFRIFVLLTTVATFIIAAEPAIADALKVRIGVYLKGADLFLLGVVQLFGHSKTNES